MQGLVATAGDSARGRQNYGLTEAAQFSNGRGKETNRMKAPRLPASEDIIA